MATVAFLAYKHVSVPGKLGMAFSQPNTESQQSTRVTLHNFNAKDEKPDSPISSPTITFIIYPLPPINDDAVQATTATDSAVIISSSIACVYLCTTNTICSALLSRRVFNFVFSRSTYFDASEIASRNHGTKHR